jgi:hypothetical protein
MIIKTSAQEIKAGLPVKDDWYPGTIKSLSAKPSKNGEGIDKVVCINIDDKSPEGRDITNTLNASFPPSHALWAGLILSADDKRLDPKDVPELNVDTDNYAGKKVKVKIKNDLYNGSNIPKFQAFLPASVNTEDIPF